MEDSIRKMETIIKKCDDTISQYGESGHIFMDQIQSYHPFKTGKRQVAIKAISLKRRLNLEIRRLKEGDTDGSD